MQNRAASHWQWGAFKTLQGPKISAVSFSPVLCLPVVFDLWRPLSLPCIDLALWTSMKDFNRSVSHPPVLHHHGGWGTVKDSVLAGKLPRWDWAWYQMAPFWNETLSLASIHGYFPLHQRQISGIIMTSVSLVLCPHLFFDCQLSSAVHPRIPGRSVLCGGVFLSFGCCGGGSGGGWEIWTRMAQMPQTILGGGALEMTIFLQELRLGELIDDILRGSTLTQTRWYLVL